MSEAPEYRIRSNAPFALDCILDKTLTVAAWVESSTARAEAMQPLVSQWQPRAAFDSFDAYDAGHTDGLVTQGYFGAVFDGRYVYYVPFTRAAAPGESVFHGTWLRYDTAAPGPSFTVNTTGGAVSIAAHQTLAPGVHHLVGVYDGAHIQLYIDGALAASRSACDRPLQQTAIPVTIGHIAGGSARFQGTITEVYLSPVAQSSAWVAATYHAGAPT